MPMRQPVPIPVEFLLSSSVRTVQEYEMARLQYAAKLIKEGLAMLRQAAEANADALFARTLREYRGKLWDDPRQGELFLAGMGSPQKTLNSADIAAGDAFAGQRTA